MQIGGGLQFEDRQAAGVIHRQQIEHAVTTAHVATGALLLATSLALSLRLLKVFGFPKRQTDVSLSAREVTA